MTPIDEVLRDMAPYAPGAPEPVMVLHARNAAIDFLRRVQIWRDHDEFDIEPGDLGAVCAPDYARVHRFTSVTFNDKPLEPVSFEAFERLIPEWRSTADAVPRWYSQSEPNTIVVAPQGTGTLAVGTILVPSDEADVLPDFLMEQYRRDIAHGGLASLLMLPGQPFTNPELAAAHGMRFAKRLDELFSLSVQGQQRAPMRTRARFM
ncbi:MAG: hypothetical protein CMJ75_19150 [Planctomycetaceae bacterium]|nr:hypothetical protein [Planctomycetaceae bacterium]